MTVRRKKIDCGQSRSIPTSSERPFSFNSARLTSVPDNLSRTQSSLRVLILPDLSLLVALHASLDERSKEISLSFLSTREGFPSSVDHLVHVGVKLGESGADGKETRLEVRDGDVVKPLTERRKGG
jgi:hypothetical protein